jgi:hypothetical protein
MTPASKALQKLKGIINVGYYINKSEMEAITEACNNYVPPSNSTETAAAPAPAATPTAVKKPAGAAAAGAAKGVATK